ncbi:MAG: RNA polymerase sigma factor, partial [Polyangiaceae bacterium]|nr:RNA polymerase sigma factor [Polyangiaceae bacterium]
MTGDVTLMERLVEGDRQALRILYERHAESVYRVAVRFLGNTEDARDVTQSVFVAITDSAARFRPEAKLTTFIYRI